MAAAWEALECPTAAVASVICDSMCCVITCGRIEATVTTVSISTPLSTILCEVLFEVVVISIMTFVIGAPTTESVTTLGVLVVGYRIVIFSSPKTGMSISMASVTAEELAPKSMVFICRAAPKSAPVARASESMSKLRVRVFGIGSCVASAT